MAEVGAPIFLTQADFARRRKVSRKTVTGWKQKGLLVVSDTGLVDVDQTEWSLDQRPASYRGGVTHRPVRAAQGNSETAAKLADRKPASRAPQSSAAPKASEPDGAPEDAELDPDAPNLTLAEAVRRKENFLGLRRKQEFETSGKTLVNRVAAERLIFELSRDNRDAWLAWPARISVLMANELSVDARVLTTVLTAHVQQHLAELGEPEVDLARD